MSDFTSNFWPVYIASITILGMIACLVLLWFSGKTHAMTANDNTTGHVWDGDLREMNNPLPRWWVWLFIITVVFSLAYLVIYPGAGSFKGRLGWTSVGQYDKEVATGNKEIEPVYAKFSGMATEQLAADPKAMAIGERLFMNNCAQCHGSDARGSKGFPNLTDKDWLGGSTPDDIKNVVLKGRTGNMPPMAAALGGSEEVTNVANFVLSLSKGPHDSVKAELGKAKFGVCAACHGPEGKGNPALGAPNLTDDIWLHGFGEAAIVAMINNGKVGVMPAQADKLTPAQVDVLTAYVWGLSNKAAGAAK